MINWFKKKIAKWKEERDRKIRWAKWEAERDAERKQELAKNRDRQKWVWKRVEAEPLIIDVQQEVLTFYTTDGDIITKTRKQQLQYFSETITETNLPYLDMITIRGNDGLFRNTKPSNPNIQIYTNRLSIPQGYYTQGYPHLALYPMEPTKQKYLQTIKFVSKDGDTSSSSLIEYKEVKSFTQEMIIVPYEYVAIYYESVLNPEWVY